MELAHDILRLGDFAVSLWLHTEVDPSAEEWSSALETDLAFLNSRGLSVAQVRVLVVSDGGAPNVRQRAEMSRHVARNQGYKASIVTMALSNPVKRGIATAVTWLNPNSAFFEPRQFSDALVHLGLSDHASNIWAEYGKLALQLRPNRTLALIALSRAPSGTTERRASVIPRRGA